jgi:hypothetical protein
MGIIPRPGPNRFIVCYPTPTGMTVEVWENATMVVETRIGNGIVVRDDQLDETVLKLIDVLRKLEPPAG